MFSAFVILRNAVTKNLLYRNLIKSAKALFIAGGVPELAQDGKAYVSTM